MNEIEDGGPAFPRTYNGDGHNGLSLRDYFAAKADISRLAVNDMSVAELLAGRPMPEDQLDLVLWQFDIVAKARYLAADAMLSARSKA